MLDYHCLCQIDEKIKIENYLKFYYANYDNGSDESGIAAFIHCHLVKGGIKNIGFAQSIILKKNKNSLYNGTTK